MKIFRKVIVSATLLTALGVGQISNPVSAKRETKRVNFIGNGISGQAKIKINTKPGSTNKVQIVIDRIDEATKKELEKERFFEAYLVDAGLAGGTGQSSAGDDDIDQKLPIFNDAATASDFSLSDLNNNSVLVPNVPLSELANAAPFALPLGILQTRKGRFVLSTSIQNSLVPYDSVVIALKRNLGDYNPRLFNSLVDIEIPD